MKKEEFIEYLKDKKKHVKIVSTSYVKINYIEGFNFGEFSTRNNEKEQFVELSNSYKIEMFKKTFELLDAKQEKFIFIIKEAENYDEVYYHFIPNTEDIIIIPLEKSKYLFKILLNSVQLGNFDSIFLSSIPRKEYDERCEEEISQLVGTLNDIKVATDMIKRKYDTLYKKANNIYLKDHMQIEQIGKLKSRLEGIFETTNNEKKEELWEICSESDYVSATKFLINICLEYERLVKLIK